MDLAKIHIDEIRGYEGQRIKQVEDDIRREILDTRMDINTVDVKRNQKVKFLKRSLARVKTVQTEQRRRKQMQAKKSQKEQGKA